jgi:hypothetical protein
MGALSTVLFPDPVRSIDTSTFTGNYQVVGGPLSQGARIIKFTNLSNVQVTLSWDGVHDHEILPANSFVLLDISAAKENTIFVEIQKGIQFYVKGSAGIGNFIISVYYGR